jgi:hypothetical protein
MSEHPIITTVLSGAVMLFVISWALWLWAMICFPQWWSSIVDREHAFLTRIGLLSSSWSAFMRRFEKGWCLKSIVGITILISLLVQSML